MKWKTLYRAKDVHRQNLAYGPGLKRSFCYIRLCAHVCLTDETTQTFLGIEQVKVTQPYLTLCKSMDCSLPRASLSGILQARTLEWAAMPSSRGSSRPRDWTQVFCIAHRQGSPRILEWVAYPFSRPSSQLRNWTRSPALQADSSLSEPPGNCGFY